MSKDLTDVDEFTSPVQAPEGMQSRNDAANVMEAMGQALANRTHYLDLRHSALAADAARKSVANNFTQPNQFTDITASGNVRALWLTAQDITSDRDIDCARNYTYLPPLARVMSLPLLWGFQPGIWYDHTLGRLDFSTGPDFVPLFMPVRLPHGAVLQKVEFLVDQSGASFTGYSVEYVPNYTSPGVARNVIVPDGPVSSAGAGVKIATVNFSNRAIVSGNRYEVTLYPGSQANDHVLDARVFYTDPGPRNH